MRHRGVRHGRHRLPAVHAQHRRTLLNERAGHGYVTASAPSLMMTDGPAIVMVAPCPLLMVMPTSEIEIIAPVADFRRMPPVGPGTSLIISAFWPVVWMTTFCRTGGAASASAGTSAVEPQKQPTHTGKSGSPCSNSTHTPEPMAGTAYMPDMTPAKGTHGMAQVEGS